MDKIWDLEFLVGPETKFVSSFPGFALALLDGSDAMLLRSIFHLFALFYILNVTGTGIIYDKIE